MLKTINTIILTIGMVVASAFLKQGLMHVPIHLHEVEVKGVSEKIVISDHGLWKLQLSEVGDNFDELNHMLDHNMKLVVAFLKDNGFRDDEIVIKATESGVDKWEARSKDAKKYKFQLMKKIYVASKRPELIFNATQKIDDLSKKGILLSNKVDYFYISLNKIKNEMIQEATQNARKGAEQFAKDSHAAVGHILKAYQGLFSIDSYQDEGDSTGFHKKIRVVNTIKFELR
jgi:uncharacterized protein